MTLILCLASLLGTAVGAACVVGSLRLSRISAMVTGFWVLVTGQLVAETLVIGAALRQLHPAFLTIGALAVAGAEVSCCARFAPGQARRSGRRVVRVVLQGIGQAWRHPLVVVLGLLVVGQYGWQVLLTVRLPQVSYDSLAYHLIGPATWIQHGAIVHSKQNLFSDVYPADQELLTAWVGTFFHSLRYAGLTTLPFVAMAASAVTMLARNLKVRSSLALLAGLGLIAMPAVFLQASTAYVDIAGAATVLAALGFLLVATSAVTFEGRVARGLAGYLLLAGVAAGLAAGIKSTDIVIAGSVVVIGFIQFVRVTDARPDLSDAATRPRGRVGSACVLLPMAGLSAFWYIRTWVTWNNPFYPVTLLGFPGVGSTANIIIGANEPLHLRHAALGRIGAVLDSWSFDLHHHSYIYDQRMGGFGLQWPIIVVPALVLATIWFGRRRRSYLFGLVGPVAALSIASSATWWARYTMALAGVGCVGLALCLEQLTGWGTTLRARRATPASPLRRLLRGAPGPAVTMLGAFFVAATALSMWWATNPTGYAVSVNGHVQPATLAQVRHILSLHDPEAVLSPWYSYTQLDRLVPKGAAMAVVAANQTFTYPLVGQDLQRRLVVLGIPTAVQGLAVLGVPTGAAALATALTRVGARYVLLDRTPETAALVDSVVGDPTHFLPMTSGESVNGGDVYQLGIWPICTSPILKVVSDSVNAAGAVVVEGALSDSCGPVANAKVLLYQGDQRLPVYQGSDKVVQTHTTGADGSVSFTVARPPPSARFFLRADGQRTGNTFHQAVASGVVTPTPIASGSPTP